MSLYKRVWFFNVTENCKIWIYFLGSTLQFWQRFNRTGGDNFETERQLFSSTGNGWEHRDLRPACSPRMASARCRHFLLVRLWQPLRLFFLIRFYSLKNYLIISYIIYTKFFTYFNYKTFHLNWSACMTKLSRILFYFFKSNLKPAEWIVFKQGHTFAAQRVSSFFFFLTVNVFSETFELSHNFSSFKQVFGQRRIRHFDLGCDCRNSSPESPEHRQLDHYLLRFPLWLHHFKNFRRSFGKHPTIRYNSRNLKPKKPHFWYC